MTEEFGRIVEGGEFVKPAQLNGHLCIVYPVGYHPFVQTKFSGQSGKPSDAIAVDVVDLDDKNDAGLPGKVYRNSNFMQAQLIGSLKSQIGSKVLGVFSQGVARNGMNPPWVLVDMSGDPAARERASAWLQANPNFQASPFVARAAVPAESTPAGYSYQGGAPQGYSQPPAGQQFQGSPSLDSMRASNNAAPPPAAPPQQQYAPVAGSPQLSQEDMTVLQHHRQQRMLAEQAAAAEAARQASFNDTPPF